MRRTLVLAGACGLLLASSAGALAAPKSVVNEPIKDQGGVLTDACSPSSGGSSVGNLHINDRGKSGKGKHFQVRLTNGEASNVYDILLFKMEPDSQSPPSLVCTQYDLGDLKTNGQGKGVKNVKYAIGPGVTESDVVLVLRDKTLDESNQYSDDLSTGKFDLIGK